jgi:hypothetical protein
MTPTKIESPQVKQSARLLITDGVYFQEPHGEPKGENPRAVRAIVSDELPYSRTQFSVSPSWQPLNVGWLKDCVGLVLIVNPAASGGEIEISFGAGLSDISIPPGECLKFTPVDATRVFIRTLSVSGTKISLTVYPR